MEKLNCMMDKCIQNKKELGEKIISNMKKKCDEKNSNNKTTEEVKTVKTEEIKEKEEEQE